jgi:hypothetical protein
MKSNPCRTYFGGNGMRYSVVQDGKSYAIHIKDEKGRKIGVMRNVWNVPRGGDMAYGFLRGYAAGILAGKYDLFSDICRTLYVNPASHDVQRPPLSEFDFGECPLDNVIV